MYMIYQEECRVVGYYMYMHACTCMREKVSKCHCNVGLCCLYVCVVVWLGDPPHGGESWSSTPIPSSQAWACELSLDLHVHVLGDLKWYFQAVEVAHVDIYFSEAEIAFSKLSFIFLSH